MCGISIPPVTAAWLLIKINNKNQCLVMLVKPEPKLGYLELMIAATSSHNLAQNPLLPAFFSDFPYSVDYKQLYLESQEN